MKILVALKQVPDTETKVKIAADGKSLDPSDVKWITSPYDEYALEEALRIKEAKGAEVVAVSVGDEKAKDVLRNALALGADRAVLLKGTSDDPLSVARALAAFAQEFQPTLILLGNKAFGSDHGAVGPMLAQLLDMPQATLITKLELETSTFRAEREGDAGVEVVEGPLPAVLTAQKGLNDPRYASLKGIMAAKKKTIEEREASLGDPTLVVRSLTLPPARPEGRKIEGDAASQARTLLGLLRDEAKIF